ncbi:low affinity immunoglobulin epsilon Fc receptor-like [Mercenaria mercenaria]|uniref:low affinity immunoglobulin epsilon Fc receptor-like n=1 Tax=Mercenaria mercenaria TaxID=6596 RepID=UPI00234E9543|nr:low affinity immunoglobulin epsilon Fc receptor-like [Mercenaria mercenaria]
MELVYLNSIMVISSVFWIIQICVVEGRSMGKKIQDLQYGLNNVKIRLNLRSNDIIELQESVAVLNMSLLNIDQCPRGGISQNDIERNLVVDTEEPKRRVKDKILVDAFKEEKSWIREEIKYQRSMDDNISRRLGDVRQQITNTMVVLTDRAEAFESQVERMITTETRKLNSSISHTLNDLTSEVKLLKTRILQIEETATAFKETVVDIRKQSATNWAKFTNLESKINDKIQEMKMELAARATCPSKWKTFMGYCYLLYKKAVNFNLAETICSQSSAFVADIQSEDELNYLTKMSGRKIWIGITDKNAEGQWTVVRNGKRVEFTNWYPGQPQNFADYDEDCAAMNLDEPWHDYKCSHTFAFVCKKMVT